MTDKELLTLAAKSAGIELHHWWNGTFIRVSEYVDDAGGYWNPLTDDGDALRLAVKLRLPIRDGLNGTVTTGNSESGYPIWELYGDDPYAATRRAIVRAASEIGRGMG